MDNADNADNAEKSDTIYAKGAIPQAPRWLGILAVASIALAVALFATWMLMTVSADRRSDAGSVNVRDALEVTDDTAPTRSGSVEVGEQAPEVRFDLFDGDTRSMSDLRGSPVVLNFWSSTCGPCLAEMPELEAVHQELGDDVSFMGVNVTDTEDSARRQIDRTGVTYPNAHDPQAEIMAAFGATALPRTVLVDARGEIAGIHNGALTAKALTSMLKDHQLVGS